MADRIQTFEAFWPYYVSQHLNRTCRRLHFVGTSGTIACWVAGLITMQPIFLLYSAISGYFFAWIGHFFVEKNRPATFTYPLWSLAADFKMYGYMVTGKMDAMVDQVKADAAAS